MSLPVITMGELCITNPELGNKIKNLASLAQVDIKVPRGFGLSYNLYEDCIHELLPEMLHISTTESDLGIMARRLSSLVEAHTFPYTKELLSALKKHVPGAPVVCAQTIAEDSESVSLAGQYESFLMVPAYQVPQAIMHCYASLFSERSLRRFNVLHDPSYMKSRMSVLVQEMFVADYCAVVMTQDPVEGSQYFGLEATYGACEAIVSGEVQGDMYLLDRKTGSTHIAELGSKNTRIMHSPLKNWGASNMVKVKTPAKERSSFALSHSLVSNIFNLSMRIEKHFNTPQDIELVVSHGEVIITQSRPITT